MPVKVEDVMRQIRGLPDELSHIDAILWAEGFDPRMSAEDKALVQRRRLELAKAAEGRRWLVLAKGEPVKGGCVRVEVTR